MKNKKAYTLPKHNKLCIKAQDEFELFFEIQVVEKRKSAIVFVSCCEPIDNLFI
jgi:hypothetical protein